MFHAALSIDNILSADALQCALSFIPNQPHLKFVNKHFKQLVDQNGILRKRARERDI